MQRVDVMTPQIFVNRLRSALLPHFKHDDPIRIKDSDFYYGEWEGYCVSAEMTAWDGCIPLRTTYGAKLSETSEIVAATTLKFMSGYFEENITWVREPNEVDRMKLRLVDLWVDVPS